MNEKDSNWLKVRLTIYHQSTQVLVKVWGLLLAMWLLITFASVHYLPCSGKFSDSPEQPGRRRRSKRRFSSLTNLTDLTSAKKASGGRRRRNSISLDDIQNLKRLAPNDWDQGCIPSSLRSFRGSEDGRSGNTFPPSTFGTSKKFSQYTGTSPKEKIEWVHYSWLSKCRSKRRHYRFADYTSVRDVSPPRRFSRQSRPRYLWKGLGGLILIILVCSEKGNQDMVMTRMTGLAVTYQASSSPTTSMEISWAQAVLTSQPLAGRRGEDWLELEDNIFFLDLTSCPPRGTWTGTQNNNNSRKSYFW